MDSLELSHKILLSECILYQDFMGHRFLDSFDKLKANKDADPATRFCEADALLGQLRNTLKDFKFPAEWELEFCKAVTSKTDDSAKWLCLLEDNNRIQVFEDWVERCPRFTSILPWFGPNHNWSKTTSESYLAGARNLVNHSNIVCKVIDKTARTIIEEWAVWKSAVSGEQEQSFVELLHADVAVSKLNLQCSNDESTTPAVSPLGIEDARKLLKLVGHHARTNLALVLLQR